MTQFPNTGTDPNTSWLDALNPSQRQAAEQLEGPLLVLSGAGTGKTRVLTARLANLLASGVAKPWNILAVTFTNKAAREMKERVAAMIGPSVEQVWFGTFHALAARILRSHAECVGLKANFTILDTDDQLRLLKQVMEAEGLDQKRFPPRMVLATISRWKDKGLTPVALGTADAAQLAEGAGQTLYSRYQERLIALNAVDFGDLLLHNLTIFQQYPDILARYHDRITHLMVDEYQDTNHAQYQWLSLLAESGRNLCCVGDDDQSIYGWRGAEIGNMLQFSTIYPEAQVIRLEQNYRSTGIILAAASGLIAHNENRLGKTLYTSGTEGEKLHVCGYWDGSSEARAIGEKIEQLVRHDGAKLGEMAVLVRAGFQTREIEERFIQIGLPYRVVGAKFYERQEIRDAVAYLRVLAQPADDLAFERIINTPRRGIGTATIQTIQRHARYRDLPMLAAAEDLITTDELKSGPRGKLRELVRLFQCWRQDAETLPHTELAMKVLDESGYTGWWQAQKTPEAEGRLENLKELVSAMDAFDNLGGFLEHISLVMDGDTQNPDGEVTLMTLHAAKGLEFDTVFLPGWEEGLFPSQRTLDEKGGSGLEEERRLAYVGITRARQRLFISYASSRRVHGLWQSTIPSRFFGELPAETIDEDLEHGMASPLGQTAMGGLSDGRFAPERAGAGYGPGWARMAERRRIGAAVAVAPSENQSSALLMGQPGSGDFAVGDRVFHQKFGNGFVRLVEGDKLTIAFDKAGEKKVVAGFVSLVRKGG